jgi:hypothetical protein
MLACVPIGFSELLLAEYDRRQTWIADINFYFDFAVTSYPTAHCHHVTLGAELKMGNLEAFPGKSDRLKGFAGNRL